jgi:hypothetical protein
MLEARFRHITLRTLPVTSEDDSGTIARTHRHSLIAALTKAIGDPASVGDVTLARLAAKLLSHVLDANEPDTT